MALRILNYFEDKLYIILILIVAMAIAFIFKNTSYLIDKFDQEIKKEN